MPEQIKYTLDEVFVYTHALDIRKISIEVSNLCKHKNVIPRYKI